MVRYVGQLHLRSDTHSSVSFPKSDAILEIADATMVLFVTMYMHKINLLGNLKRFHCSFKKQTLQIQGIVGAVDRVCCKFHYQD